MSDEQSESAEVTATRNGPYTIRGSFTLKGADGEEWTDLPDGKPVALCRCGRSGSKPFCDGTHSKVDFASEVTAEDDPYPF